MQKFTYNMFNEIEKPIVILSTVYHKHLGTLTNIDIDSFECSFNMNEAQEVSFDVYKYTDNRKCALWDQLKSFKYIYIPSHGEYYKIDVDIDEDYKTVKHVTGTSAGEYELSNRIIQSLEINTELDVVYEEEYSDIDHKYHEVEYTLANSGYTVLYNFEDTKKSLLHRVLKDRAPDWSIGHVDETIANKQREYSVSSKSIYDFLTGDVAEELDCLFKFDSVNRKISVYDLLNYCENCEKRGEFTDTCPECGSHNIRRGYGTDTHIFISARNYANKISVEGEEDEVKNCFTVSGGDDIMTAAVKNCNPSGSEYIYYFSESDYEDMPIELVNKLKDYNDYVDKIENVGDPTTTPPTPPYKELVVEYYNAETACMFYETTMMPRSNSEHWLPNHGYGINDVCYVMTLPSWCYLACIQNGTSGTFEFDATDYDENDVITDGTVKWKVMKHIITIPSAQQGLNQLIDFINNPTNKVYYEDRFTESKSVANRYVKDLLATVISPLFNIEILDDQYNTWNSTTGVLTFNLRVTNTTDTKDTVQTSNYLTMGCAIASSLEQHQKFMTDLIKKRLDWKDNTFTSLYESVKTKSEGVNIGGSKVISVNCGFTPNYVIVQYFNSSGNLLYRVYNHGTSISSKTNAGTITITNNGFTFNSTNANVAASYTAINDSVFKQSLNQYGLDSLKSFDSSYQECINVLMANNSSDPEGSFHGVNLYYTMYLPYDNLRTYIQEEMVEREATVNAWRNTRDNCKEQMTLIHDQLNMKNYLGDELWTILFNYLREDEYKNDNYISNGLSDNFLLEDAKTVLQKAKDELAKATELQYTLQDDLANLLNTESFKDYKDKFELGDFIICQADDQNYKLRLVSVSYQYGSPDSLSVEFSNVTKIKNYFSDVKSVIDQAQSMSSSYSAVTHQVERNTVVTTQVSSWNVNGLNSSLTTIKNNDREEVVMDNNGIVVKEYDDADARNYGNCQLRLTHNILAFTSDNWKTASLGLGYQTYWYYDNHGNLMSGKDYGLISKFVDSGYIHGSQIVGGSIYSENYKTLPATGTYMNLNTGEVSIGGGKLTYNTANGLSITGSITATSGNIAGFTISNKAIYSGTNSPSSTANGIYLGMDGIRQQTGSHFTLISDGKITATNVDLTGKITASNGSIAGFTISGNAIYNGTNSMTSKTRGIYLGTGGIRQYYDASHYVNISNGILEAKGVTLTGAITATSGSFKGAITATALTGTYSSSTKNYSYAVNNNGFYINQSSTNYASLSDMGLTISQNEYRISLGNNALFFKVGSNSYSVKFDDYSYGSSMGLVTSGNLSIANKINLTSSGNGRFSGNLIVEDENGLYHYDRGCYLVRMHFSNSSLGNQVLNTSIWGKDTITANHSISTSSDARLKTDFKNLEELEDAFYKLSPCSYLFKGNNDGRRHVGFKSQDVIKSLEDTGIDSSIFSFVDEIDTNDDTREFIPDDKVLMLRYDEFMALNTHMIQKQAREIEQLKQEITDLKSRLQ